MYRSAESSFLAQNQTHGPATSRVQTRPSQVAQKLHVGAAGFLDSVRQCKQSDVIEGAGWQNMTIVSCWGMPFVLSYCIVIYWVFRGKV